VGEADETSAAVVPGLGVAGICPIREAVESSSLACTSQV
jgi:hypothetical protein